MPDELVPELKPKQEAPAQGATTEALPTPESSVEKPATTGAEQAPKVAPALPELPVEAQPTEKVPEATVDEQKSVLRVKIEGILAKELEPLFEGLPSERQIEFKTAGEGLAMEIEQLLLKFKNMPGVAGKVPVHKIVEMIAVWLRTLPGVNKHYIEQASKIKTDEILREKQQEQD